MGWGLYISFLKRLFLCTVLSASGLSYGSMYNGIRNEVILESGGGISSSGCAAYLNHLKACQGESGPSALTQFYNQCEMEGVPVTDASSLSSCATDYCMQARGFPSGINTNPATYCSVSGTQYQAQEPEQNVIPRPQNQAPVTPEVVPVPQQRPENQTGQTSSAQWAQESSQDISQCSNLQSQANTCCSQPERCSSQLTADQKNSYVQAAQAAKANGDAAGLEQICKQSREAAVASGNVNTGFANICYSKHSGCTQTCSTSLEKWRQRLNNCGTGCDRSLVDNTVNALQEKQRTCQQYASLESQIRSQAVASAEDSSMAQLCQQQVSVASTDNQNSGQSGSNGSAGGSFGSSSFGSLGGSGSQQQKANSAAAASSYQSDTCAVNPNAPGCSTNTSSSGGTAFSDGGGYSENPNDFNVGVNNNFNDSSGHNYNPSESSTPQSAQGHAIPNGGGGVPGEQNSQQAMNNTPSDLPAMLGSGVNPNILQESLSGGSGYSPPAGNGTGFDGNTGSRLNSFGANGQPGVDDDMKKYRGMDLKKYLPGGDNDPRRQLAGTAGFHQDIGPKHVDFFQRVSSRLQTLCKLKRLLDCQ